MNPLVRRLAGYMQEKMNAVRDAALKAGGPVFDFGIGDPREPTPAFIKDAFRAAVPDVSQYPSVAGAPPLRRAIAGYLQRRFQLSLDPDAEILPCAGAKEALFHLPLAFVSADRPLVYYPDPSYPVYERAALFAGGEPRTLPLKAERAFLPDLDAIKSDDWKRTAIVFDCYPHNPTGAGAPRSHHQKLAALADEFGFVVVADEPYVDLYIAEPPHTALQVARKNVLAIHSLSKRSGMTGYRSGFIAGEPELMAILKDVRANFGVASQHFVQAAAQVAWADDAHVAERRKVFADKRALLMTHLSKLKLEVGGEGAFYLWVKVPDNETSESYADKLGRAGILVVPGPSFGREGKGFIRLAMVPTLADCARAIDRWPR